MVVRFLCALYRVVLPHGLFIFFFLIVPWQGFILKKHFKILPGLPGLEKKCRVFSTVALGGMTCHPRFLGWFLGGIYATQDFLFFF